MPSSLDFNAACYLARYPDVRNSDKWKHNPYGHYKENGQYEGRAPGCDIMPTYYDSEFNGAAYLARYPDVEQSSTWRNDPYGHFVKSGAKEGRIPGFEIITPSSPVGFTSPGTTEFKDEIIDQNAPAPGDGEIYTEPDLSNIDTTMDTGTTTTSNGDFMTWITANPIMTAAIAAGILILLHESKKNKKRKRA